MIDLPTLIPILLAGIFGWIAAWTDNESGMIFDYTTFPMIAIGFISILVFYGLSLISEFAILSTFLVFLAGKKLNEQGAIGGGDVKLMMGYNLLIPLSVFIILPLAGAMGGILHFRQLDKYVRLGPLAFFSFMIMMLVWMIV